MAEPIPLSSLDMGFCLCLSCSSPDFFVCDFVLTFYVKGDPRTSINEGLHFVCQDLCYVPGFTRVKRDSLYGCVKNPKLGLDGDDL